ncbi:MAG: hypothetical protein BKP49_11135 [Treponema sp. CETP13]|nr:MAG: hypothetical protein BKP49_11135 [Treponema sp. CETP13]
MSRINKLHLMNFLMLVPGGFVFLEYVKLPIPETLRYIIVLIIGFGMVTYNIHTYRKTEKK